MRRRTKSTLTVPTWRTDARASGRRLRHDETPAELKDVVAALNASAAIFSTQYLAFLALVAFVGLIVSSTDDRTLLIGRDLPLPILNLKTSVVGFYALMPFLLLLMHINLMALLRTIFARADYVNSEIASLGSEREIGRLRSTIIGTPYLHLRGGLAVGPITEATLSVMFYASVVLLPGAALLFLQWRAVAYHSPWLTHLHQVVVAAFCVTTVHFTLAVQRDRTAAVLVASLSLVLFLVSLAVLSVPQRREPWRDGIWQLVPKQILYSPGQGSDPQNLRPTARAFFSSLSIDVSNQVVAPPEVSIAMTERRMQRAKCLERLDTNRSELDLSGRDLRFANFKDSVLIGLRFEGEKSRLDDAHLQGATIASSTFRGANLSGANFEKACILDLNASEVTLDKTIFTDATVRRSSFTSAKGEGSDFSNATITRTSLDDAMLEGADFSSAWLAGVDANRAGLNGVDFRATQLANSRFAGASLVGARFTEATLIRVDLARTNSAAATMKDAQLFDVDFSSADLRGATFDGGELFGVSLVDARLGQSTFQNLKSAAFEVSSAGSTPAPFSVASANTRGGGNIVMDAILRLRNSPRFAGESLEGLQYSDRLWQALRNGASQQRRAQAAFCVTGPGGGCVADARRYAAERAAALGSIFCDVPAAVCPVTRYALGSRRSGRPEFPELQALLAIRIRDGRKCTAYHAAIQQNRLCDKLPIRDVTKQLLEVPV